MLQIIIDGTTPGDGSVEEGGMCQKIDPDLKCLSSGDCRKCSFVAATNRYEGCGGITSEEPICDADSQTDNIQYATSDYDNASLSPACAKCTKTGNINTRHAFQIWFSYFIS